MPIAKLAASLLVLVALVVSATPAPAETVNCTHITSLPAVITVQGIYCFTGNLSTAMTSGNAIDIQTNNVTIDLNGFKLGGLAAGPGTNANGIFALDRQNITIKNGTVRGFIRAISLDSTGTTFSQGHVVEEIRADQNTFVGILVSGANSIIRNNHVGTTGGTTAFGANADAFGIAVNPGGFGTRVLNNDIDQVLPMGTGTGVGIRFEFVPRGLAVNNRITGADKGILYSNSDGKFRDNITVDVSTPYPPGGTNIGNNN